MKEYRLVEIELIDDPEQPMRIDLDDDSLNELAESVRQNGIIEPLIVREKSGRFEVIAGHRRLAAAGIARLGKVPVIVRNADDRQTAILRMHENLLRQDTSPLEEAQFIAKTVTATGWDVEEMARAIGRGIKYVEDRLTIAEMPEYMQQAIHKKEVSLGVALELYGIDDEHWRKRYFEMACNDGMSIMTARQCRVDWQAMKQRFEDAGMPLDKVEPPAEAPIPLAPCAKCGATVPLEELKIVRIHRSLCNPS